MGFFKAVRPFFPFSYREKTGKDLALSIVIYVLITVIVEVIAFVLGFLAGLTQVQALIWAVMAICGLLGTVAGIYSFMGIALAILHFVGVIDKVMKKGENQADEQ